MPMDGALQKTLNRMIRKYAIEKGISYRQAWIDFKSIYNSTYHTDIDTQIEKYLKDKHVSKLTIPLFLKETNRIADAIKVMDRMLDLVC